MSGHARLSCSAAHRWSACPGAPRLEAQFPETTSVYAEEGTTAHALLETALLLGEAETAAALALVDGATEEMAEALQPVLIWVREQMAAAPGAELLIEVKVDPGHALGRDDLWGTADLLILVPPERRLIVGDLKYGAGRPVEVEDNPQLRLYGLGALARARFPVESITLAVLQPRAPHADGPVRVTALTRAELETFATAMAEAAARTDAEDAPLVAGSHCTFCRAAGGCAVLADHAMAAAREAFRAVEAPLTPAQAGALLREAETIRGWLKALEAHVLNLARTGVEVPGWKLASRRGHRAWIDPAAALAELTQTYGVALDVLAPPVLMSPAQVEKAIKAHAKRKPDVSALVRVPELGPRLVPSTAPGEDLFAEAEALFEGLEE
ncbi:MAG: DUF2800 domain-containing protein [Gammaproteobacteria bacterium]|nr:DUF2800 domain-containing protein [Gammaproteobacteria bacterium]